MRASTAAIIALVAALSSTAPVLSAPLTITNLGPSRPPLANTITLPLLSSLRPISKLPIEFLHGNHPQRRDVEDIIQLVARALEDDESGAFSFDKLKNLGGVAGDLFSIGSNIHDFL